METRKVQVTGGSTFTVSLPKQWATDSGISNGSTVWLYTDADSLVVTPRREDESRTGTLDVSGLADRRLIRAVMTMYVRGFDVIEITAGRITTDQRNAIRKASRQLVGVEVVDETTEYVLLQDLLDSAELSITNAVSRMRLIATSMLEDAVTALVEADDDLAVDVVDRDDDVDRLFLVVSRIFRSTLRSPHATEDLGISREDCFDYHSSARQLERVADHAVKIARAVEGLEDVPDGIADDVLELKDDAAWIVDTAMDALTESDPTMATELGREAVDAVRDVDERTRSIDDELRELDPVTAHSLGLVVDSLSRTADYGVNVAENALLKAAPRP